MPDMKSTDLALQSKPSLEAPEHLFSRLPVAQGLPAAAMAGGAVGYGAEELRALAGAMPVDVGPEALSQVQELDSVVQAEEFDVNASTVGLDAAQGLGAAAIANQNVANAEGAVAEAVGQEAKGIAMGPVEASLEQSKLANHSTQIKEGTTVQEDTTVQTEAAVQTEVAGVALPPPQVRLAPADLDPTGTVARAGNRIAEAQARVDTNNAAMKAAVKDRRDDFTADPKGLVTASQEHRAALNNLREVHQEMAHELRSVGWELRSGPQEAFRVVPTKGAQVELTPEARVLLQGMHVGHPQIQDRMPVIAGERTPTLAQRGAQSVRREIGQEITREANEVNRLHHSIERLHVSTEAAKLQLESGTVADPKPLEDRVQGNKSSVAKAQSDIDHLEAGLLVKEEAIRGLDARIAANDPELIARGVEVVQGEVMSLPLESPGWQRAAASLGVAPGEPQKALADFLRARHPNVDRPMTGKETAAIEELSLASEIPSFRVRNPSPGDAALEAHAETLKGITDAQNGSIGGMVKATFALNLGVQALLAGKDITEKLVQGDVGGAAASSLQHVAQSVGSASHTLHAIKQDQVQIQRAVKEGLRGIEATNAVGMKDYQEHALSRIKPFLEQYPVDQPKANAQLEAYKDVRALTLHEILKPDSPHAPKMEAALQHFLASPATKVTGIEAVDARLVAEDLRNSISAAENGLKPVPLGPHEQTNAQAIASKIQEKGNGPAGARPDLNRTGSIIEAVQQTAKFDTLRNSIAEQIVDQQAERWLQDPAQAPKSWDQGVREVLQKSNRGSSGLENSVNRAELAAVSVEVQTLTEHLRVGEEMLSKSGITTENLARRGLDSQTIVEELLAKDREYHAGMVALQAFAKATPEALAGLPPGEPAQGPMAVRVEAITKQQEFARELIAAGPALKLETTGLAKSPLHPTVHPQATEGISFTDYDGVKQRARVTIFMSENQSKPAGAVMVDFPSKAPASVDPKTAMSVRPLSAEDLKDPKSVEAAMRDAIVQAMRHGQIDPASRVLARDISLARSPETQRVAQETVKWRQSIESHRSLTAGTNEFHAQRPGLHFQPVTANVGLRRDLTHVPLMERLAPGSAMAKASVKDSVVDVARRISIDTAPRPGISPGYADLRTKAREAAQPSPFMRTVE